jgi:hypothetical protein
MFYDLQKVETLNQDYSQRDNQDHRDNQPGTAEHWVLRYA